MIEASEEIKAGSLSLNQIKSSALSMPMVTPEIPLIKTGDQKVITVPIGSSLQELEKRLIIETLHENGMNRTKTAATLGISIRTLRNKLHEYVIDNPEEN